MVVSDLSLRQDMLQYLHENVIGGHSGMTTTLFRVGKIYYWKKFKEDVYQFVRRYVVYQRCKGENMNYPCLLQPLLIPEKI